MSLEKERSDRENSKKERTELKEKLAKLDKVPETKEASENETLNDKDQTDLEGQNQIDSKYKGYI